MKIQTLHIFNPEHDIALAANLANFTAPHAGRQLRHDLAYIPALWAGDDDAILVESIEAAERAYRRLRSRLGRQPCLFVDKDSLRSLQIASVDPWGWDLALRAQLLRWGVSELVLPTTDCIAHGRLLSHRRTSAQLLPSLRLQGTVGEAVECNSIGQVVELTERWGSVVLKAPWSSSGRGVRFDGNTAWAQHIIERQGSVMVEPFFHKVKDFGMEFMATDEGIRYEGLSLFQTQNGAYTGNVLSTERAKREALCRYLSPRLLDGVREAIVSHLHLGAYRGPFGVDMMIVSGLSECLLHPCVEINLRRTMGHVALLLQQMVNPTDDDDISKVMRVIYNGTNYQLKIQRQ